MNNNVNCDGIKLYNNDNNNELMMGQIHDFLIEFMHGPPNEILSDGEDKMRGGKSFL